MTGGASFRVQVGAEAAFDRLGSELSGYYRLGVEQGPGGPRWEVPFSEGAGVAPPTRSCERERCSTLARTKTATGALG